MEFAPINERAWSLSALDDALPALAGRELLENLAAELARYPELRGWGLGPGSPDLLRGWIALRIDRVDEAAAHFETGLEWAEREGLVLIAGRCHQSLADLAERRGDEAAAMEHLDRAGERFQRHGAAKLYLDQVLAKKQILRA